MDHKNRNTIDNHSSNLRIATQSTQIINQRMSDRNTSGTKGVFFNPRYNSKWVAVWSEGKKQHKKYFYVAEHGDEEAKALAVAYRKQIEETKEEYTYALCK